MTGNANTPRNLIINADCINAMRSFDRGAVDFMRAANNNTPKSGDNDGR